MTITREKLKTLRVDFETAVAAVAKKHGVMLSLGTLRFNENEANGKLKITAIPTDVAEHGVESMAVDNTSHTSTREANAATALKSAALCQACGADPSWAGRKFDANGVEFEVIGLLPNRPKYPILASDPRGKNFVFASITVRHSLV